MSEEIYVEQEWDDETYTVTDGDKWLATFLRKEDAEAYADSQRLDA
jgi:hypothetical protein